MRLSIPVAVATLLLAAAPVSAKALKAVPTPLDPTKAYVLVTYMRVPNPYYGTPLAPKFIPQMGGLTLGRYDPALHDIRGMGKAAANPVPGKQGPIERFQSQAVMKTETALVFLHELEPDTYVVQGWSDTSFSLGSYSFEAKPGMVVDLGVVSGAADWAPGEEPKKATVGSVLGAALAGPFAKAPPVAPARVTFRTRNAATDPATPSGLPADRIVPVAFENGATFGNYLGGLVNRIEGVNAKAATPQ